MGFFFLSAGAGSLRIRDCCVTLPDALPWIQCLTTDLAERLAAPPIQRPLLAVRDRSAPPAAAQ